MKRSGLLLIVGGAAGMAFFLATDPRIMPKWATRVGWSANLVDATSDALAGTVLGLAGALVIFLIGLWLLVRKAI